MTAVTHSAPAGSTAARWALAAGLCAGTLALFAPVLDFGFLTLDDHRYVAANPWIASGLDGATLRWSLTAFEFSNWHPLTWLSLALDAELQGLDPAGFHATNLALHVASTLLLFGLLDRATGRPGPSAFAAALFAWHPLHVEPVAWVSERKELLAALLGLLAIACYGAWTRRGGRGRYAGVVLLAALSLLAKPMWVTLPLLLLCVDLWPLGRLPLGGPGASAVLGRRLLEKVPLALLSLVAAALTLAAQAGAIERVDVALPDRLANAIVAPFRYLALTLWPAALSVHYPHPALPGGVPLAPARVAAALAGLVFVTGVAVRIVRRRPVALAGWAWFLVGLLPVLGLVQTGSQGLAARYTYVPLIGVFTAAAWLGADALAGLRAARPRLARFGTALALGTLAACAARSADWLPAWRDSTTLYARSLEATPTSPLLLYNLGNRLLARGEWERARHHYEEALRLDPGWPEPKVSLAWLLATARDPSLRDPAKAVRLAEAASAAHRGANANTLDTLAAALAAHGDFPGAIRAARRAEEIVRRSGPPGLLRAVALRRRLYESGRVWREGPDRPSRETTSKSTVR